MKTKRTIKDAYLSILPAQVLVSLIPHLTSIINGIVVGNNFSPNTIAIIGYMFPFLTFMTAIQSLFSYGGQIVAGNLMGAGELEKVNKLYSLCIQSLFIIGAALTVFGLTCSPVLSNMLGVNEAILAESNSYIRGLSIGFIATLATPFLMSFLQLAGSSTHVVIASALNAGLTLVFDMIALNVFKGDVFGIGLATALAQLLTMTYLLIMLARTHFVKFKLQKFDFTLLGDIAKSGYSRMGAYLLNTICTTIMVRQIEAVGGLNSSTATSIFFSACGLVDCLTVAGMTSITMLGSVFAGEENEEAIHQVLKTHLRYGALLNFIGGILFIVLANPIAKLFGASGEILPLTVTCLRCYALHILIAGLFEPITSFFQAIGKTKMPFVLTFIAQFVCKIIIIFALGNTIGVVGIWLCYFLTSVIGDILLLIVAAYSTKKQNRPKFDFICYDGAKSFKNTISVQVKTKEDLANALDDIEAFCLNNGVEKPKTLAIRLSAEENIANILDHGFTKSKKKDLLVDTFVGLGDEKTRLIYHDNSVQFDPLKRFTVYEHEGPSLKGAGIKIVNRLAKNISYQFTFGMNVLMVDM